MSVKHHSGSIGIVYAKPKGAEPYRKPSGRQREINDARVRVELLKDEKRLKEEFDDLEQV